MIPLFFSMLVDTVAVNFDYHTVRVHEWGVIQMDYGYQEAVGAEWCFPDENGVFQNGELMVVDAPVVWFHGPEFTGTFTVEVMSGTLTARYPEPDVIEQSHSLLQPGVPSERAVWEDLVFTNPAPADRESAVDKFSDMPCQLENFSWAAPWWREVPALTVTRESDGWSDQFIYYECTTGDLPQSDEALTGSWANTYRGPALVFAWHDDELVAQPAEVGDMLDVKGGYLSVSRIEDTLCQWAGSNLKSEEIEALWLTWEPVLRGRCQMYGERVLLFPLSDKVVESISRLELNNDQGYFVEYHRLFLGLTAI
jgi:hypothetical protein